MLDQMLSLFKMNAQTMNGIAIWGNIAIAIVVYLFKSFSYYLDYNEIYRMVWIRVCYVAAYFLLYMRGVMPDLITVDIGNTCLFVAMYMEAIVMMRVTNTLPNRGTKLYTGILIGGMILFNVGVLIKPESGFRIQAASVIIFGIYLLQTLRLLFSENVTVLKRNIGIFYAVFMMTIVIRIVMSISKSEVDIHSNEVAQTLFYLGLLVFMLVGPLTFFIFIKEKNDKYVEELAAKDDLTKLPNKRHLKQFGKEILRREAYTGDWISVLFMDIDDFKYINDTYGHDFGDSVLAETAKVISGSVRDTELPCRFGGEEFAVLMPKVNEKQAVIAAERICKKIREIRFSQQSDVRITTSIGICSVRITKDTRLDVLITSADEAMYQAKKNGKDQIAVYRHEEQ